MRTLHARGQLQVTHAKFDGGDYECRAAKTDAASAPVRDAIVLELQLRDALAPELWEGGAERRLEPFVSGHSNVYDLRGGLAGRIREPFEQLRFFLPLSSMSAVLEARGAATVSELVNYRPGVRRDDPTVRQLGQVLLPAFEHPEDVSDLFVEHLLLAVRSHVATNYFGVSTPEKPVRGGLAARQLRRAQELLKADLGGQLSLSTLAAECGLSQTHFARAFRKSTGVAPHRWLQDQRVAKAKALLASAAALSDVALACGFNDQSHFSRVFGRVAGMSPGAWRRGCQ
jgi:AraC family transcriptional regulator